jgi:hypothetical protein
MERRISHSHMDTVDAVPHSVVEKASVYSGRGREHSLSLREKYMSHGAIGGDGQD